MSEWEGSRKRVREVATPIAYVYLVKMWNALQSNTKQNPMNLRCREWSQSDHKHGNELFFFSNILLYTQSYILTLRHSNMPPRWSNGILLLYCCRGRCCRPDIHSVSRVWHIEIWWLRNREKKIDWKKERTNWWMNVRCSLYAILIDSTNNAW